MTRYMVWKSVNGEATSNNQLNYIYVIIQGIFLKEYLLDITRNFILFQDSNEKMAKIVTDY